MKNSELTPIIDGDILVYRVGFAVKDDEPVEYALSTVKNAIGRITDKFPDAPERFLFLSGKGNFREDIATLQVYKGNRDPSHRPFYYQEIKDYMIKHQGAIVVEGQESDDAMAQLQWSRKDKSTVICSIDKDLRTCPGYHYHIVKDTLSYVNLTDANAYFFHQMLEGDRTDNIPGIKGIGKVKAAKILADCNKDPISMRERVMEYYRKQYGPDADRAYWEVSNLLWIRREEGKECPF